MITPPANIGNNQFYLKHTNRDPLTRGQRERYNRLQVIEEEQGRKKRR